MSLTPPAAETRSRHRAARSLARLAAAHPSWLAAHAQAYADLALEQAGLTWILWQRRLLLRAVSLVCGLLGAGLAGLSAILWTIAPQVPGERLWVLLVTPALPWIAGFVLWLIARGEVPGDGWRLLKAQWAADKDLLRGRHAMS